MLVMCEREEMRFPIRVWLEERKDLEKSCREQAYHLSQLLFLHRWVYLMPDTHAGMGMPIRGVIATDGAIIPNAVGVDIGCGMAYTETNIKVDGIREIMTENGSLIQAMVGDIMRNVPVGFVHRKTEMPCYTMEDAFSELGKYEEGVEPLGQLEAGFYQIGTLDGGNHFIELRADDEGYLCVMIHSGSRHIGKSVCDYFHFKTRELSRKWYGDVPDEYRLAFLLMDIGEGRQYLNWMQLPTDFAKENRERMVPATKSVLEKYIGKYTDLELKFFHDINYRYDYVALEHYHDKDVWAHRKGAVRAGDGELVVIPGAMGSYSYVITGRGNPESSYPSPYGAERHYSRKDAMAAFPYGEVMVDLQKQGVILGKKGKADIAEENRFACKDIQEVMNNQLNLVMPVKRLRTIGVVKG